MKTKTTGICLADEMGLGKTVQALAFIANQKGLHLIVAPTSLIHNWKREAFKFVREINICIYHGSNREIMIEPASSTNILITTYTTLTRAMMKEHANNNLQSFISKTIFDSIIFDEAQYLKTLKPLDTKIVTCKGRFYIAITGTPLKTTSGSMVYLLL